MSALGTAQPWWKTSVCYQIYPRSFCDANGDGFGDIAGIRSKIDYLADLGVEVVWFSPMYVSPQQDNGYDIADYDHIDPRFGTDAEFDQMVAEFHDRGIRVVMDLVVNHTSDQHPWFQDALAGGRYRDYYIWRQARTMPVSYQPQPATSPNAAAPTGELVARGDEPNDWQSFFSGPAWTWHAPSQEYYLHLFANGQPDLNWDNPQLREDIFAMMRRWIDRGVDGFRMDVINLISKPEDLETEPMKPFGPHFHDYLQQMRREVFDAFPGRVFFTVGETPGATIADARATTDPLRRELDMVFQFEHVGLDHNHGNKFDPKPLHLPDLKHSLARWNQGLHQRGWNSLYLENHDQPRSVSRFGDDRTYWAPSATALAAMLHAHQGTPFIYQGQELGMTNYPFRDVSEFEDIESINYATVRSQTDRVRVADLMPGLRYSSRDNARTPMQWCDGTNAGFTTGTPWLGVNPNYRLINAAAQQRDPRSIRSFYQRLIRLRRELPILVEADFELRLDDDEALWWIERHWQSTALTAIGNFGSATRQITLPAGELILDNYSHLGMPSALAEGGGRSAVPQTVTLAPWQALWWMSRA